MSFSAPVIAFAIVGGFLGRVMAREDTYQHLKIFDDVVSLISSNYVEDADIDKVMRGAMHGLADSLDPDSAYLTAAQVKQVESGAPLAPAGVGLELTRQYYLRVIAARDNSPAAKAGPAHRRLHPRDQRHADARHVGVGRHARAARRAGLESVGHHHPRQRQRSARHRAHARERAGVDGQRQDRRHAASATSGSRRSARTPRRRSRSQIAELTKGGASKLVVDVRRASSGTIDEGLAIARLFVGKGTLAIREAQGRRA